MAKENKYHELLDKLAKAIRNGKNSDVIDRIKEKIEKAENELYAQNIERKHKK